MTFGCDIIEGFTNLVEPFRGGRTGGRTGGRSGSRYGGRSGSSSAFPTGRVRSNSPSSGRAMSLTTSRQHGGGTGRRRGSGTDRRRGSGTGRRRGGSVGGYRRYGGRRGWNNWWKRNYTNYYGGYGGYGWYPVNYWDYYWDYYWPWFYDTYGYEPSVIYSPNYNEYVSEYTLPTDAPFTREDLMAMNKLVQEELKKEGGIDAVEKKENMRTNDFIMDNSILFLFGATLCCLILIILIVYFFRV